jgi:hypothetical protein
MNGVRIGVDDRPPDIPLAVQVLGFEAAQQRDVS